jgi:hypothetical protein
MFSYTGCTNTVCLFPTTPKQNLSFSAALKKLLFAVPVGSLIQIPSKSVNSEHLEWNLIALNNKM